MRIDVLYQFNENYAPYAGISITSLFENNRTADDIRVYILGENLSGKNVLSLERAAEKYNRTIIFIDTVALVSKMKELNMPTYRGSYAANMRLFLPDVLSEDIDRLLYLDADTIVARPLDILMDMDIGDYPIAMVLDSLGACHKKEIGLGESDYYFNSGVILFQMRKWREMKLTERIAYHIQNVRSHYPSPDQDLINVVCKGNIYLMDARYNYQPIHLAFKVDDYYKYYGTNCYYRASEIQEAKENVVIYHFFRFVGEFPWNAKNVHPDNRIFDTYMQISEWKDYKKEPAVLSFSLKIEKILYILLPKSLFIIIFSAAHQFFLKRANQASLRLQIDKEM